MKKVFIQIVVLIIAVVILITVGTLLFRRDLINLFNESTDSLNTILLYVALILFIVISYVNRIRVKKLEFAKNDETILRTQIYYSLQEQVLFLVVYWMLLFRFVLSGEYFDLLAIFVPFSAIIYTLWKIFKKI
ncbi:hypothetical protein [Labilibaculum euxinus]